MKEDKQIKIISWNIAKKSSKSIINEIKEQKADIIILSELPVKARKKVLNKICDENSYFEPIVDRSDEKSCGLSIMVLKEKVKSVEQIELELNGFQPDLVLVKVTLHNNKEISILGTRFKGNLNKITREEAVEQLLAYISVIKNNHPQIMIGDMNWYGVIKNKKAIEYIISKKIQNKNYEEIQEEIVNINIPVECARRGVKALKDLEEKFLEIINDLSRSNYIMWPLDKDRKYSYIAKRGNGKSSPDRIIYEGKWECRYFPEIAEDMEKFPNDEWESDHAMLIAMRE